RSRARLSRPGRGVRGDRRRGARGDRPLMGSISGRILIAGTSSLLMCVFLSPKFIAFVRRREFGQNIREEGPQGHQTKAGTPTLGGIVIIVAFAVPFLILSQREWKSMAVFGATVA